VRIVFAGTPEFAERALAALIEAGHEVALVLTQPDRPSGRGLRATQTPVKRLAGAHGIEVYQPESLRARDSAAPIALAAPEVIVVAAYGLILPQPVLELAPLGALNIHASLLPRWRGAAPIQRAIMAGDAQTGITIMQMDSGLDTGPMLMQRAIPIAEDDDAGSLHDKLAALGAELIVAALDALPRGALHATPQPTTGISYAHKLGKPDGLLDWSRPAQALARQVRALRPAPGAVSALGGEPIKIWRVRPVEGSGIPGRVIAVGAEGITVACGVGALQISRLQRAGGKPLDAAAFLRGRPVAVGESLERTSP
jgi:methionyl-tRNA formyltransferase